MDFKGLNVLQVVGPKKSGKTTHVTWLISELRKKGLRIGAFKHSIHTHPIDRPGSDSYRMQQAGAWPTVFRSAEGLAVFYPEIDEETFLQRLPEIFSGVDLLIVESFSSAGQPKIVLDPDGTQWKNFENVIAIVSTQKLPTNIPTFAPTQSQLIDFVLDYFGFAV